MRFLFLTITIFAVLALFSYYLVICHRENPIADVYEFERNNLGHPKKRYPMKWWDVLWIILICIVYGTVAFIGIGDKDAPQSFCEFSDRGIYADIELPDNTQITRIQYYSGLFTDNYFLQYSQDGVNFTDECVMEQKYTNIFKWNEAKLEHPGQSVKYLRILSGKRLEMGELCIYDINNKKISPNVMKFDEGVAPLFDEQEFVPKRQTYKNSTYFDEIYHVRTAEEHIKGIPPYEISHPPLGKIIIGTGIRTFGLTPFGWRLTGVLFGILMLPCMYVLIKNMFGNTAISACGTTIFAFDFMHFVQTRISTIDTYAVFFIILMYLFMYRYITAPRYDPNMKKWHEILPLFLSGLFMGLGCASKWTCVYAGFGLGVIWLIYRITRYKEMKNEGRLKEHKKELRNNILQCILFFIIIPAVIYYVSYYPYGKANGMSGIEMFFDKDYAKTVFSNQQYMFNYHSGVTATHPYSSRWYQWIVDGRPILYYLDSLPNNMKTSISAFMNPLVCWSGLLAIIAMVWKTIKKRDGNALFILLGYLAQLVPWMFISRITFEYHYFPCLVFLVLALCHMFNSIRLRNRNWGKVLALYTTACILMFIMFYPVLSGTTAPRAYTDILQWIPNAWPF